MRAVTRALLIVILVALLLGLPPGTSAAPVVLLSGFPALHQQHSLTCESSAASMGTRGVVAESQIMAAMPRSPNPNLGFRGNPDGRTGGLTDYGVYAPPVHNALLRYGYRTDVITYGTNDQLASYINRGWPVVVWITWRLQRSVPRLGQFAGIQFILVPHEHALLLVGFSRRFVYANDPSDGSHVRYTWQAFDRSWGYFGNMALAIQPCAIPGSVDSIKLASFSTTGIRWSWPPAPRAALYRVTVTRRAKTDTVLFQATVNVRHIDLNDPSPTGRYDVSVQPVSACGQSADPTHFVFVLPPILPTPTPGETTVVQPTPLPTFTSTPTSIATPTPTATPNH